MLTISYGFCFIPTGVLFHSYTVFVSFLQGFCFIPTMFLFHSIAKIWIFYIPVFVWDYLHLQHIVTNIFLMPIIPTPQYRAHCKLHYIRYLIHYIRVEWFFNQYWVLRAIIYTKVHNLKNICVIGAIKLYWKLPVGQAPSLDEAWSF